MYIAELVEVAIGLVLVYLTVSLACSQIHEWFARWFNFRAKDMEDALSRMIKNPKDTLNRFSRIRQWLPRTFFWHDFRENLPGIDIIEELHAHPLIAPLIRPGLRKGIGPEQIPASTFAAALFDVVMKKGSDVSASVGPLPGTIKGAFDDLWKSPSFSLRSTTDQQKIKAAAKKIVDQADEFVKRTDKITQQVDRAPDAAKIAKDFSQLEKVVKDLVDKLSKWVRKLFPTDNDIATFKKEVESKIAQITVATEAKKASDQTLQLIALSDEYASFISKFAFGKSERQILLKAFTVVSPLALQQLKRGVEAMAVTHPDLSTALNNFLNRVEADGVSIEKTVAAARAETEKWFNDTMERATVWYKLNAQKVIFVIGLALALLLNIDTLSITKALWREPALRQAVADQAKLALVTTSPPGVEGSSTATTTLTATNTVSLTQVIRDVSASLNELNVPIGWTLSAPKPNQSCGWISFTPTQAVCLPTSEGNQIVANAPSDGIAWLIKIIGLLATALAVSQGAPFWYDMLAKLVNIGESTLKEQAKPDKSP